MSSAGVIELSLGGRGPRRAYVFDPHRLALPCWAEALQEVQAQQELQAVQAPGVLHAEPGAHGVNSAHLTPAVLLTLDRHFDLVPPRHPPARGLGIEALEAHTRASLDVRNVDHVLAAMEAGVVAHAICLARARPVGAEEGPSWTDSRGERHELVRAATIDALSQDFGRPAASPEARRAHRLLEEAAHVLLDVDLDCFTTPSDADPTAVIPWPEEAIRQHLLPRGSEAFWQLVLSKCVALTLAREPLHCGGLLQSGRLFEALASVLFGELLETDLP